MPTSAEPSAVLLDTSAAVPLLMEDHDSFGEVEAALSGRADLGLAGHAAFETYSVLTRLPASNRRSPSAVSRLIEASFPASRFLGSDAQQRLLNRLAPAGIGGGAVFDALVGACALEHGLPLATRDRRALPTYRALGVDLLII